MAQFLDDTIYTDYALNKICENLAENISNFNFIKVKVGSGDSSLYQSREDLSMTLYSLVVQDTSYDEDEGILTIKCEFPPELTDVTITEIGLFDTVLGYDHLFSYSKVNITKPSDIGYELTIVLNLGPRTIDFPGITSFYIPENEYATVEVLDDFNDTFIFISTNLERAVRSNAGEIGRNMAEVAYRREKDIRNTLRNNAYAGFYYSCYNKFRDVLGDVFFVHEPNYLSYDICNFTDSDSYLEAYYDTWQANKDSISWHNGPATLLLMAKLNDLTTESTVINKKNSSDLYFSIDVKKNTETYAKNSTTGEFYTAEYNELVITFYGMSDIFEMRYIFDMNNVGQYVNQSMPYVISFNGDFTNPDIHFYFNCIEPTEWVITETSNTNITTEALEELQSQMYGRIITSDKSTLSDMPDNSYVPIKNYIMNYQTSQVEKYDNATGITNIITLKKQANKHELAFLCNSLITMNETAS
jgi:hypothetical protein